MTSTSRRWEPKPPHPMWLCPQCGNEYGDPTDHEIAEKTCPKCLESKVPKPSGADVLIPRYGYVTKEEAQAIANPGGDPPKAPELELDEEEEEDGGLADA